MFENVESCVPFPAQRVYGNFLFCLLATICQLCNGAFSACLMRFKTALEKKDPVIPTLYMTATAAGCGALYNPWLFDFEKITRIKILGSVS